MENKTKQDKAEQIKDILRLHFLESCTYKEITVLVGVSRPTARKYIDNFKSIASSEDMALKDTYKEVKRRVPFPARWNKYVKIMVANYAHHPKRVATPTMKKKIISTATDNLPTDTIRSAMETYKLMHTLGKRVPSYNVVAKVIKDYLESKNAPSHE